jgi:hypothetical protein
LQPLVPRHIVVKIREPGVGGIVAVLCSVIAVTIW